MSAAVLVLDVGKTHAKLTLVDLESGAAPARIRANEVKTSGGVSVLDAEGIEAWAIATMGELAAGSEILAIAPVAHGAAAALLAGDALAADVIDYEAEPPAAVAAAYGEARDPFARTLSPRLPGGLNLGVQFRWRAGLIGGETRLLPWAQYWAFRLCGEMASEVTSLGCHTDLWFPREGRWSDMAVREGWAARFAPRRGAGEALGRLRGDIAAQTGISEKCEVLCGLHDSNASLCAARALPEVGGGPFRLVSTGTWFVAMASGGGGEVDLDEARGAAGAVDIAGDLVPTARFMGGRQFAAAAAGEGTARASANLAEKTDAMLSDIGGAGPIVIEGLFAADPVFTGALASLRPDAPVLSVGQSGGVALGAARLFAPHLKTASVRRAAPLTLDPGALARRPATELQP